MVTISRAWSSLPLLGRCSLGSLKRPFSSLSSTKLIRGDIVLFKGKRKEEWGDVVQLKGRPSLVISIGRVMEVTNRVALTPLSTASSRYEYEVVLPSNVQTGIRRSSKVMANQVFTVSILKENFVKIGSATNYLPFIDRALTNCFGDYKVDEQLEISRGDIVEIDFGNSVRSGVVVSNDMGNRASRIAMLAYSRKKGGG